MSDEQTKNAMRLNTYLETATNSTQKYPNISIFLRYHIKKAMDEGISLAPYDRPKFVAASKLAESAIKNKDWKIENFDGNEYDRFLEDYYSKINFKSADLNLLMKCKALLDINPIKNDLNNRRIDYFNKRIASFIGKKIVEKNSFISSVINNNNNNNNNVNNNNNSNNNTENVVINPFANNNNSNNNSNNKGMMFKTMMVPSVVNQNSNILKSKQPNININNNNLENIKFELINELTNAKNDIHNDNIESAKDHFEKIIIQLRKMTNN